MYPTCNAAHVQNKAGALFPFNVLKIHQSAYHPRSRAFDVRVTKANSVREIFQFGIFFILIKLN